jgi:1,4-alpha-glucan branching enzyme
VLGYFIIRISGDEASFPFLPAAGGVRYPRLVTSHGQSNCSAVARLFAAAALGLLLFCPAGASALDVPVGASVKGKGAGRIVTFRVWAPHASSVAVSGEFNGWKKTKLKKEPTRPGYWVATSRRARPGDAYQYIIDGHKRRDPRARAVNAKDNVGYIVDPDKAPWGPVNTWKMPPKNDLVMYEMHVGTFADGVPGKRSPFRKAIKRLPYLKALGINCIQLMPVNEFTGERSWGYNPGDPFAIESSYGGVEDFKRFIHSCHTNGIAVMLDVVHNHYGPEEVALWEFDPAAPDNPHGIYFYSDEERAMTEWGPRPDYSRREVRDFIVDSIQMFIQEYRLDGFRWDSVHNIRYYQSGASSNADGDRTLSAANDWMKKHAPDALRVAEDHAFDGGGVGFDAQWNSAFQSTLANLVRGPDNQRDIPLFASELEQMDGFNWVNFAECHDSAGDLNQHHRLPTYIDPANPDSFRARALSLLANGIVMTVPGYPMMLQGFEMHDTDDFSDNTPIPWARAQQTHKGIVRATADLIHLRRNTKGFTPGLQGDALSVLHADNQAKVIAYSRHNRNEAKDRGTVVVLNLSGTPLKDYGVRFPSAGTWFCHFNSSAGKYAKDFDNRGPMAGQGYRLPASQTTLPLDMGRYSMQVFSKSRPPNAQLSQAKYAEEIEPMPDEEADSTRKIEEYIEEILDPFPYQFVPLPEELNR